ncbi:MAG TPA: anaerobic glycerol-3-phosphate dehydrogenase subunit C [Nitrospiria bacterium]|jgi:Fe-S oxidoreductase
MNQIIDFEKSLNPEVLFQDTLKVFDICNGCRRCFNLCPSFDFLFKKIDARDGEIDQLETKEIDRTVDLCYYCKLCYNHCPYTPPHRFNLDFPLLMIRSKAVRAKSVSPSFRDRLLANTDFLGKWSSLFAPMVNWGQKNSFFRKILHSLMGIHQEKLLPTFSQTTFPDWFTTHQFKNLKSSSSPPAEKVALFSTCFINYNQPEIGAATVEVLEKNGVEVSYPEQNCCGMPYFDTGDFEKIRKKAWFNIQSLKASISQGMKIVVPMPTCSLMLKKEYTTLFPGEDSQLVASNTYDLCEYLMKLNDQGKLDTNFKQNPGKIFYQIPCHLRDQNIGYKSRDLMKLTGASVNISERCSGHDGTWSVKKEYFDLSLKIGDTLFKNVQEEPPDIVCTDCPLSGLQMEQGTGKKSLHPIQVIHQAYGLDRINGGRNEKASIG